MAIKVKCDGAGCKRVLHIAKKPNEAGLSATYAADLAERNGWWARSSGLRVSTPNKAYCPEHRPASKNERRTAK
jgi:hypothetical protein